MAGELEVFWTILFVFSVIDIVISVAILFATSFFAYTCSVDTIYAITYNVTLEQIEFFYDALKDCGYSQESSIPSTKSICRIFYSSVLPFVLISIGLTVVAAVAITATLPRRHGNAPYPIFQISGAHHHRHSNALRTLAIVTFETVFAIGFGIIALYEYTNPRMCFLKYSIAKMQKYNSQTYWKIFVLIMFVIYKPLELLALWKYGNELIKEDSVDYNTPMGSATMNLASQLQGDSNSATNIQRMQSQRENATNILSMQPQQRGEPRAVMMFPQKKEE